MIVLFPWKYFTNGEEQPRYDGDKDSSHSVRNQGEYDTSRSDQEVSLWAALHVSVFFF